MQKAEKELKEYGLQVGADSEQLSCWFNFLPEPQLMQKAEKELEEYGLQVGADVEQSSCWLDFLLEPQLV